MDCSWLVDDDVSDGGSGSDSDSKEVQDELESRLYSIIHHNDLSQPLDPTLAKHYSVHSDDNGEVVVTLNDSLAVLKSEESKTIDQLQTCKLNKGEIDTSVNEPNDDDVVIISEVPSSVTEPKRSWHSHKRMRYSDVNLDEQENPLMDTLNGSRDKIKLLQPDLNFFKLDESFFNNKKHKPFKDLIIPEYVASDWKVDANSSFISIDSDPSKERPEIMEKIKHALKKVNPTVHWRKLCVFAEILYKRKKKRERKRVRKRLKNYMKKDLSGISTTLELAEEISVNEELERLKVQLSNYKHENQKNAYPGRTNGSISLNISPFIPTPVIDLESDQEQTLDKMHSPSKSKNKIPKQLPNKWTEAMIKFYTKPSKKKWEMDIDQIIEKMGRTSIAEDWKLEPRDRFGFYQSRPHKSPGARCANCRERGHLLKQCPKPQKIPTCILCGDFYHSHFSCPNKICFKCGVYISNDNGECDSCYYLTFESDVPCETCGKVTHRSQNCPDFWRSFHSTTEGEKKIPDKVVENKRKYCCNCSRRGHFSHDCVHLTYSGQQTSCFVTNYSAIPSETGSAKVVIPIHYAKMMNSPSTDYFMQNLSNTTSAEIAIDESEKGFVFRISGTFEQCTKVKSEIETFVNTNSRKRKRNETLPRRKKQRTNKQFYF